MNLSWVALSKRTRLARQVHERGASIQTYHPRVEMQGFTSIWSWGQYQLTWYCVLVVYNCIQIVFSLVISCLCYRVACLQLIQKNINIRDDVLRVQRLIVSSHWLTIVI